MQSLNKLNVLQFSGKLICVAEKSVTNESVTYYLVTDSLVTDSYTFKFQQFVTHSNKFELYR